MRPLILAAATLALAACAPAAPGPQVPSPSAGMAFVTVSATYRERILLTPGHVVTMKIEDVSLADAPARVLAETSWTLNGEAPPYEHRFGLQRSEIDPRRTYAARAEIRDPSGDLRFVTDTRYAVLTQGSPDRVEIILRAVP